MEKYENVILEDEEGKPGGQNMIWSIILDKKSGNKFIVIVAHLKAKEPNENIRIGQINHLMKFIEQNFLRKYLFWEILMLSLVILALKIFLKMRN